MRSYAGIKEELAIGRDYQARANAFVRERPGWFVRNDFPQGVAFLESLGSQCRA